MQLIQLTNGRVSLEFGSEPVEPVLDALRAMPRTSIEEVADIWVIHTASGRLILTEEWEGTALISTTRESDALLGSLAARFSGDAPDRLAS